LSKNRHEFLAALHAVVRPRTYLEIGVNDGRSLALSRVPTIGIDPAFKVTSEIRTDLHLARSTSDEFFGRRDPLAHLPMPLVDLAFIDGMHLSDYTLRDFMNVERYCAPGSVIVFDDMLSRNIDEAARLRHTGPWTGDVYKVLTALRELRPDLVTLEVDTVGSGMAVVLLPDPSSRVLHDNYDRLVAEMVSPDPQDVPLEVLTRSRAVDPDAIVNSSIWPMWVHLRDRHLPTTRRRYRALLADQPWARPRPVPAPSF
jgi:predicted O-methyltransferase YrrM